MIKGVCDVQVFGTFEVIIICSDICEYLSSHILHGLDRAGRLGDIIQFMLRI